MRHSVWLARLSAGLLLLGFPAMAADPNTPGSTIMIANPGASGPPFTSKPASDAVPVPVKIIGSPALCSGCATSALQTAGNASLVTIATNTTGVALDASIQQLLAKLNTGLTVSWTGQSVSLTGTLPAFAATPTFNLGTLNGASTAANQATEITSLGTIATNSGTQATAANQTTGNTSAATTAANTTAISTGAGAPADTAYAGSGSSSIIAALKGIYAKLVAGLTSPPLPIVVLDATTLSGSAATTVLTAGHAVHGGWIAPNVAYCVNASITGATAGTVPNTPAGTECYAANQPFAVPPLGWLGTVSVNSLVAGVAQGKGSL